MVVSKVFFFDTSISSPLVTLVLSKQSLITNIDINQVKQDICVHCNIFCSRCVLGCQIELFCTILHKDIIPMVDILNFIGNIFWQFNVGHKGMNGFAESFRVNNSLRSVLFPTVALAEVQPSLVDMKFEIDNILLYNIGDNL